MNKDTFIKYIIIIALALIVGIILKSLLTSNPQHTVGSVSLGSEYHATSTLGVAQTHSDVIEAYPGALGSVVITGTGTGSISIYDAARTGDINATNTIATVIASLPQNTYTFDALTTKGLVFVYTAFAGTATITYR